jgi:hypothetical protein
MPAAVPPVQRRRTARDLAVAKELRPRDIWDVYGIAPSTLCVLATHEDAARRPLSRFIRPRGGRKGLRLFDKAAFEAWKSCWDREGNFDTARWAQLRPTFEAKMAA